MKTEGVQFLHAYDLIEITDSGKIRYVKAESHPNDFGHGVYVVECGSKIVYIGSYQTGVQKRWVYLRSPDVYHFKKNLVTECIRAGDFVRVYAQTLEEIKRQLDCSENKWVNAAGIEAHLIAVHNPIWNKHGKKKSAARAGGPEKDSSAQADDETEG